MTGAAGTLSGTGATGTLSGTGATGTGAAGTGGAMTGATETGAAMTGGTGAPGTIAGTETMPPETTSGLNPLGIAGIVANLNENFLLMNLTWSDLSSNVTRIGFFEGAAGSNGPLLLWVFNSQTAETGTMGHTETGAAPTQTGATPTGGSGTQTSGVATGTESMGSSGTGGSSSMATFTNMSIGLSGRISGFWMFNSTVSDLLKNGRVYLTIFTENKPEGEIRGQVELFQSMQCFPIFFLDQVRMFNETLQMGTMGTMGSMGTAGTGTMGGTVGGSM
jgi:hypothetical protein